MPAPLPAAERRSIIIPTRVTIEEAARLRETAASTGASLSDLVRGSLAQAGHLSAAIR
jgi:hypothetical protein